MRAPIVSVAVCTHNRAPILDGCLASLSKQSVDLSVVEVLVVDDGSTDGTAAVVERWQGRLPLLGYTWRSAPGLSSARNIALDIATSDVVAFLDDDARAAPSWLEALLDAFADPDVEAAGGPVVLSWPSSPPTWMQPDLEHWFSALDLGSERRRLSADEQLVGSNMSFRRAAALRAGGFDTNLGRIGRRLRSGEDWRLLDLVRESGGAVAYEPDALVVHEVLPERTRITWLVRRCYEQGRTNALYNRPHEPAAALRSERIAAAAPRGAGGRRRPSSIRRGSTARHRDR